MLNNRRILLTGASGFLGKALLPRMLARGCEVVNLGRNSRPLPGVTAQPADLSDPGSLRSALTQLRTGPRFDAVVHLAVSRHHREFPQKALDLFHVNTTAAAELLEFARVTGVTRAVFGSTGTVYSATARSTQTGPGNAEDEFRRPSSYFAATKLFADTLCDHYRGFLPVATLRFYAPYGPGLQDRMLVDLLARVRDGRPVALPASGPGLGFAAIYVDDALAIIDAALAQDWNETVNAAAPEHWTIESASRLIGDILGRTPVFERGLAPDAARVVPQLTRLAALMPGHPYVGLADGLRRMLAHPDAAPG